MQTTPSNAYKLNYLLALFCAVILGIGVYFALATVFDKQQLKQLERITTAVNHTVNNAIMQSLADSTAKSSSILTPQNLGAQPYYEQSLYYRSQEAPGKTLSEIRFIKQKPVLVRAKASATLVAVQQVDLQPMVKAIDASIATHNRALNIKLFDQSSNKVISSVGKINADLPSSTTSIKSLPELQLAVQTPARKLTPFKVAALVTTIFGLLGMLWAFNKNRNLQQVQQLLKAQRQRGSYVNESDFDFLDVGKPNTIALALESNAPVSAREGAFAEPSLANQPPNQPEQEENATTITTDVAANDSPSADSDLPNTLSQAGTGDGQNTEPSATQENNRIEFSVPLDFNTNQNEQTPHTEKLTKINLAEKPSTLFETVPSIDFTQNTDALDLLNNVAAGIESPNSLAVDLPAEIFRSYDIRGDNQHFDETRVKAIGKALGSQFIREQSHPLVVVGFDARSNSEQLSQWLISGLNSAGITTIAIGCVPTPAMHFAAHTLAQGNGIMVTASHSPANCNGFKWLLGGKATTAEDIQQIYTLIQTGDFTHGYGNSSNNAEVVTSYMAMLCDNIAITQPLKIAIDGMHGSMGLIAKKVFAALGTFVNARATTMDGTFPEGNPDPSEPGRLANLADMVVQNQCYMGFAFDGEGDRLAIVDAQGHVLNPDLTTMLLAKIALATQAGGDVFIDAKTSRATSNYIGGLGGIVKTIPTGNTHLKQHIAASTNSVLGAEIAGHYVLKMPNGYWSDDALFAALSICDYITAESTSLTNLLAEMPKRVYSHDHYFATNNTSALLLQSIQGPAAMLPDIKISNIDGLRLDYEAGFVIIRQSNTANNNVSVRLDADSTADFARIKQDLIALVQPFDAILAQTMQHTINAIE